MRKLLLLLFLVITIAVISPTAITSLQEIAKRAAPCNQPIHYRIETVDNRFGITREKFLEDVVKAESVWETPIGRDLFVYDPKGELSVNMIYDDRQSTSTEISKLKTQITQKAKSLEPQIADYQKRSAEFNQKVKDLNSEIDHWNQQGGAPQDKYAELKKRQEDLKNEADSLNALAKKLNISTDTFNSNVDNLNQEIGSFNNELQLRPEEGLFIGSDNRIEIYFYYTDQELVHTAAHELGHSLGLPHVDNKKAVMYQQTNQTISASPEDISALKVACKLVED